MKLFLRKISEGKDLTITEARDAMAEIMDGRATDAQIASFLIALKMKGESTIELTGFVETMRERATKICLHDPDAVDLCGTGGDGSGTFNISTAAAFVVAGAGITVAKHGNRSVSSQCGSADVLKALGVNVDIPPARTEAGINSFGIGFLFAPAYHPAMKHAARARAELGIKTCFNMLGPMTNPAGVRRQLVGAFSRRASEQIASVLQRLGARHALVFHAEDGMDEISLSASTDAYEVKEDVGIRPMRISPEQVSLKRASPEDILGGNDETNAAIIYSVLSGKHSPHRDIVLMNAAHGMLVAGKSVSFGDALALAAESIDSGQAMIKLQQLREYSNR